MLVIQQQDKKYFVRHKGKELGYIEVYDNAYHATNCYVKVELNSFDTSISKELWRKLSATINRPLQVMVQSSNLVMTNFLTAGGFVCKRKCYEIDATVADYIGCQVDMPLCQCSVGDKEYDHCCRMIYEHYVNTHLKINPLTADYVAFCTQLPDKAIYAKNNDKIVSVAFVEDNEIAYVCSDDKEHFCKFAQALVCYLFSEYDNICFESDDCDWTAITLKNLFINQSETSYCTYILDID